MIKGGLLRYAACQNPHNHQVAAVLASPRALHSILLSSSSPAFVCQILMKWLKIVEFIER